MRPHQYETLEVTLQLYVDIEGFSFHKNKYSDKYVIEYVKPIETTRKGNFEILDTCVLREDGNLGVRVKMDGFAHTMVYTLSYINKYNKRLRANDN